MRQFIFPLLLFLFIIASLVSMSVFFARENTTILTLYGNVDVRQVQLGFRLTGRLEKMNFDEGDRIKKGNLMATLEKKPFLDFVNEAKAQYQSLQFSLENATLLYERRKQLLNTQGITQEEYETSLAQKNEMSANVNEKYAALQASVTDLNDTDLFAPIDGFVFVRMNEPGAIIKAGEPVYILVPTDPIWIQAYVSAEQLSYLKLDMKAKIMTDTSEGKIYEGKIGFISPTAVFTPKTIDISQLRTDLVYAVRIYLIDSDSYLHDGMPVTVRIPLNEGLTGEEV